MSLPTPERLSELIGSIYDCVLDREKWAPTLTSIFQEVRCSSGALTVHDGRTADLKIHVAVGMDDEWLAQAANYAAPMLDLWGGQERIAQFALEEPVLQSDATPRSTWPANPWYRSFAISRKQLDCIAIGITRDARTFAAVAFGVNEDCGEVQDSTVTALRLIAPHLRRAIVIGRVLEDETSAATTSQPTAERV